MRERRLEVADVFRTYEKEFFAQWGHVLGPHQRKAFEAIRDCRTAVLGGHVDQCDECGHRVISYNSCRNRPWRALNGWPRGKPNCCRSRTSMLYLRCRKRSARWHFRMGARFIAFFFGPYRKPCLLSRLTPDIWEPRSAFWLFFTPGDRTYIFIHISNVSCQAAV